MKNCLHCKHADWKRTKAGKLHPSGEGRCKYPWKMPKLPASMYWIGQSAPEPFGGRISRNCDMKEHCAYFEREIAGAKTPDGAVTVPAMPSVMPSKERNDRG
jgi:hypothetical protein